MKLKHLFSAALIAAIAAMSAPVLAEETQGDAAMEPRKLEATYEVTWQGLTVFEARLVIDVSQASYRVRIDGRTAGLAAYIAPMTETWRTAGRTADGAYRPLVFVAKRQIAGAQRSVELTFDREGTVTTRHQPPLPAELGPLVSADLRAEGGDPLTELLKVAVRPAGEPACDATMKVYDGQRRVDATLAADTETEIPAPFIAWLRPKAQRCLVELDQLAPGRAVHDERVGGTSSGTQTLTGYDLGLTPKSVELGRMLDEEIWLPLGASLDSKAGSFNVLLKGLRVADPRVN